MSLHSKSKYIYTAEEESAYRDRPLAVWILICNSHLQARFDLSLTPEQMKQRMKCFLDTRAFKADKLAAQRRAEIKRVKAENRSA